MSVPIVAFFSNEGGVGRTSLVYHLAWMFAELDLSVLAADLDPQSDLTAMFLDEERLEELWPDGGHPQTVYGAIEPQLRGVGDIADRPHVERIDDDLHLLVGDLALAGFEDELSRQWRKCLDGQERAFRALSAFRRLLVHAAREAEAALVLVDLGPNLGAINRSALIAADAIVIPLTAGLFSLQGLRSFGPRLHAWREQWRERVGHNPAPDLSLPPGRMEPAGYVLVQRGERLGRPVRTYERWIRRIPRVYAEEVLRQGTVSETTSFREDGNCIGLVEPFRSLMPLAQEARKPMFRLKAADGAIGAYMDRVREAYRDFRKLAREVAGRCWIDLPAPGGIGGG